MLLSVVNKDEINRRVKRNRLLFWLGIGGLIASMVTLFITAGDPNLAGLVFLLGYPFLIIGLILSKRASFNNRRHGVGGYKIKGEDQAIVDALDGVPPRYHLYNWIKLGDLAVDHLLVTPMGLMIIDAKSQQGDIRADNDRYQRKAGMLGWIATLGEPGIGNPSRELDVQVKKVRAWFEEKGYELPTDGVVVFTFPTTKILKAEEMSYPVCHIKELKQAIRGWETEINMTVSEQQEVEELIIKNLPPEIADEARALAQMPGYKRAAMVARKAETKEKEVSKEKEKPKEEAAPKPKLTPEERERLRQERIKAAQEKGRQPVNPFAPPEPGKKIGLDGKVREKKPAVIEKKPPKRRVEPLRKPPAGAFGNISDSNKKK